MLTLIKVVISVSLIALVFFNIKSKPELADSDFLIRFLDIAPQSLIAAFGLLFLSMILNSLQWHWLLSAQKIEINFKDSLKYYFVGLFFNNFMLGNAGGDVKKIYDITKKHDSLGGGFTATIFDRLFGLFFLNGLSLAMGVFFFAKDPNLSLYILPSTFLFVSFIVVFCALFSQRFGDFSSKIFRTIRMDFVANKFDSIRSHFYLYRKWNLWLKIIPMSSFIQILRVSVHYVIALGLGIDLPISYFLYFIPIIAVVSALPISIGGFGPREFVAQKLFLVAGVSLVDSVIIQLLAYGVTLIVSLLGAIEFMRPKK